MAERVLPYPEALAEVLAAAEGVLANRRGRAADVSAETVSLERVSGRVLAAALRADRDQPPFPRSTRDGFAVGLDGLRGEELRVVGLLRAGERPADVPLGAGEALEIMTGAPAPEGAAAVLMVEHALVGDNRRLRAAEGRTLRAGDNIVPRGAEARAGAELVPCGRRMGAAEVALAASCGYAEMEVFPRTRVAILATGDELVEVATVPAAWQIRNSNSYTLGALVEAAGGVAERLPVARDTLDDLRERLAEGRRADLLLLSGGVSMGKYDLVEEALREAGAEFLFTGTLIQPGKPLVFGRLPATDGPGFVYFFGLPGNPISTEVCFRLFATPLLRALGGETATAPRFAEARLAEDVRGGAKVTRFLPAVVEGDWAGVRVRPVPWQGSGDLAANGRANAFLVLPAEVASFAAGDIVRVLLR